MMERLSRRQLIQLGAAALAQVPSIDGLTFPDIPGLGDIDPVTARFKAPGRKNIFYGGMATDEGQFSDQIDPFDDNFIPLRQELRELGWALPQTLNFKYGRRGLSYYSSADTIVNPEITIQHALDDFNIWLGEGLTSANLIGFSLGGIPALATAMAYTDKVDSLTLFSSPILGIRYSFGKWLSLEAGKRLVGTLTQSSLSDEKVSQFLFNRWADTDFKKSVDEFGQKFISLGKPLNIIYSVDDPIFNKESVRIEGGDYTELTSGQSDLFHFLEAHGRPVRDPVVAVKIAQVIGSYD